jgi:hypothetical protein
VRLVYVSVEGDLSADTLRDLFGLVGVTAGG